MPSSSLRGQYNLYNNVNRQQTGDYSEIMNRYRQLLDSSRSRQPQQRMTPQFETPQDYNYTQSGESSDAIRRMRDLTNTGGYSEEDKSNLRARGTSPIRSVYAGANRDINRNRSLQGGFSANFNAVKSKNAREMSDLVSGATQNVNAGIAEQVAQNKIGATGRLAELTGSESALRNQYGKANIDNRNATGGRNTDRANMANQYNLDRDTASRREDSDDMFRGLEGMRGLFGTTPAMSSLFGSQAQNAAGMESNNKIHGNQQIMDMIRQLMSRRR